jgi:hypothetical protein
MAAGVQALAAFVFYSLGGGFIQLLYVSGSRIVKKKSV